MAGRVLRGSLVAEVIREEVAAGVRQLQDEHGAFATLASVSVGDDPAARDYVRLQEQLASDLGIRFRKEELPSRADPAEVASVLDDLSSDPQVDGVVVQLPLPPHLDEAALIEHLEPHQDVDGVHPINMAWLAMKGRQPLFAPSTALAVLALLDAAGATLRGAEAVVVGRSSLVGLPAALLLMAADATVTIAHTGTRDLGAVTRTADILVTAAGSPGLITGDMVKPGAIAIDVAVTPVDDPASPKGYRMAGDLVFEEVREVAATLTPVPGGVGPVTVAMLMRNTLTAAQRHTLDAQP